MGEGDLFDAVAQADRAGKPRKAAPSSPAGKPKGAKKPPPELDGQSLV